MNLSLIRSSLDRTNNVDISFMKRRAFHDTNILIVNLDDDKLGWADKQLLLNIGEKLYGKQKPAGG